MIITKRECVNWYIQEFIEWLEENPLSGPFVLSIIYIFCSILFVPGSILTLGAGFAFNQAYKSLIKAIFVGFVSVWIGASIGSCISMLLGRFVFIDWVNKQKQKYPMIKAINIAI